jgi:hypothetical protein
MAVPVDGFVSPAGSSHRGRPSFLARYRTLPDVRLAIDTLETQGVDGEDLALVGKQGELPGGTDRRRSDSRFLSHTMLVLTVGVLGGALAGALVGAVLIGLIVLMWSGLEASGWVFLLLTAWFAAGGAVLGCFFAISRAIGFSEAWPLTFEDETQGPLWLAVYDDTANVADLEDRTHPLEAVWDPPLPE